MHPKIPHIESSTAPAWCFLGLSDLCFLYKHFYQDCATSKRFLVYVYVAFCRRARKRVSFLATPKKSLPMVKVACCPSSESRALERFQVFEDTVKRFLITDAALCLGKEHGKEIVAPR
jgi:hypothetical protein